MVMTGASDFFRVALVWENFFYVNCWGEELGLCRADLKGSYEEGVSLRQFYGRRCCFTSYHVLIYKDFKAFWWGDREEKVYTNNRWDRSNTKARYNAGGEHF